MDAALTSSAQLGVLVSVGAALQRLEFTGSSTTRLRPLRENGPIQ
jgi:hypothetical protein